MFKTLFATTLCSFSFLGAAFAADSKIIPNKVINDSWYTMQAGSAPWGYFHEIIEEKDGKISYRYAMRKFENGMIYEESMGALSTEDLTPIAFNLVKSGSGAVEMTNATYTTDKFGGVFTMKIQGAKAATLKRNVAKDTIIDVFFPVWLKQNWSKLKPGYNGWVKTFAEDGRNNEFRARTVKFSVKGMDTNDNCLKVVVNLDNLTVNWCMRQTGTLIDISGSGYHIRRVNNEAEAKAFVAGIAPKQKK